MKFASMAASEKQAKSFVAELNIEEINIPNSSPFRAFNCMMGSDFG